MISRVSSEYPAFEAYLQWHRVCYVAVDETRRAMMGDTRVKSLDFIVYGHGGARLLVDVKGRRFPGGSPGKLRRVWECWSSQEDVDGLERWAGIFGSDYLGLLVFAYHLAPEVDVPDEPLDLFTWRGRRYLFRAVPVAEYRHHLRVRSPKWGTVDMNGATFRRLVQPLHHFTHGGVVVAPCPLPP